MDKKKSFILHYDSLSVIDKMSDDQVGKLFRMMKSYHNGRSYVCDDFAVELVFEQFRNQFDRDLIAYTARCDSNAENWKKWWRPQWWNNTDTPEEAPKWKRYVYLLQDISNNEVKIWETSHLKNRIYTIKRPTKNLKLLYYILVNDYDSLRIESDIKNKLALYSIWWDWFNNIDVNKAIGFLEKRTVIKKPYNDSDKDSDNVNDKEELFNEFWNLYPNKKWKPEAQKKYPHKDHEAIMVWLQNQIKEYEAKKSMWSFVPEWQHWSTWINKKTRLDYQDTQSIEDLNFEAIYQEYVKDYDNNYAENWKKKYWVSHEPDSLFMRCKKRVKDEWLFKY